MDFHISVLGHTLDFFPDGARRDTGPDHTPLLAIAAALVPLLLRASKEPEPHTRENDMLQAWGSWLKKLGETPNPADFPQPPPIQGLPPKMQPFAAAIHLLWGELGPPPVQQASRDYSSILVNGKPRTWFGDTASYRGILMLTDIPEGPAGEEPRITYTNGSDGEEGALQPGEEVEVVSDMIFNVVAK